MPCGFCGTGPCSIREDRGIAARLSTGMPLTVTSSPTSGAYAKLLVSTVIFGALGQCHLHVSVTGLNDQEIVAEAHHATDDVVWAGFDRLASGAAVLRSLGGPVTGSLGGGWSGAGNPQLGTRNPQWFVAQQRDQAQLANIVGSLGLGVQIGLKNHT